MTEEKWSPWPDRSKVQPNPEAIADDIQTALKILQNIQSEERRGFLAILREEGTKAGDTHTGWAYLGLATRLEKRWGLH